MPHIAQEGIPVARHLGQLGHANATATLNLYANAIPAGDHAAAGAIARQGRVAGEESPPVDEEPIAM